MIEFIRLAILLSILLLGCYIWIKVFKSINKWVYDLDTKLKYYP